METRKEKHDRYIRNLQNHIDSTKESTRYSSDRFDVLIISLSTSALVFSIGFVKDIIEDIHLIDTSLLKTSWLLFVLSIVSNLISQISGYYSNNLEISISRNLIREERGKSLPKNHKILELIKKNLNKFTIGLNGISFISLIGGICLIVLFFSNNI
ncbi:hypothetical protein [Maribellus sediminis]|uniref:hypothetical protein n=1 Tax=Maribellus sediminis TaxID=2696285 RepID=UPI0014311D51|nr:hypothetical protein [Maribellus sediminis]